MANPNTNHRDHFDSEEFTIRHTFYFCYLVIIAVFCFFILLAIMDGHGKLSQNLSDLKIAIINYGGIVVGFVCGAAITRGKLNFSSVGKPLVVNNNDNSAITNKISNMKTWIVPLTTVSDLVNSYQGNSVNQIASLFASNNNTTVEIKDEDPDNFYPDMLITAEDAPVIVIEGNTVTPAELIGGYHPNRPK